MGSLRVIELQLVAFIVVFSASGLVSLLDLAYPAFVSFYLLALSRFAFPSSGAAAASPEVLRGGRASGCTRQWGRRWGYSCRWRTCWAGSRGGRARVRSATPHLFLLSFQILTENVLSGLGGAFSPPVRALVPLLYTVRRIFVIIDWVSDEAAWVWFGRGLAVANLAYFSVNLFTFLIPRFLPRAFERYFKDRNELLPKTPADKRPPPPAADAVAPPPEPEAKPHEEKKSD
ncbi:unnamed protein product [Spirodela intermedia]|uniref:DUF7733 domain-containing protein n=1 Tax=Spirodela intermedia TaxID=51605 RepID=A0A7I8J1F4_SPIIN|nr:unnamed protein product [Spirodela intermedia]CAA6664054.1 unnamed protein product [Spirodela intermedia]